MLILKKGLFALALFCLTLPAFGHADELQSSDSPSFAMVYDSPHSFTETLDLLRHAISAHNFRLFDDRYLEQGLTHEFVVNERQVSLRFCNFSLLDEALKIEPKLGVLLPCTITVVEDERGAVKVYAANLRAMASVFNKPELDAKLLQIEAEYLGVLEEVTL